MALQEELAIAQRSASTEERVAKQRVPVSEVISEAEALSSSSYPIDSPTICELLYDLGDELLGDALLGDVFVSHHS